MDAEQSVVTVAQALSLARSAGLDRLESQTVLGHVLGKNRAWLIAHEDQALEPVQQARFAHLVQRRAKDEPMAYLLGQQEFHGLALRVSSATLVPRPDTEILVDWALEVLPSEGRVLDMGTGTGAIALAMKHRRPDATVSASDVSEPALDVARANGRDLALNVEWLCGSWWDPVDDRTFDLIVSNPPYIAAGDPHLPKLRHEPMLALSPGGDGLDALREICRYASTHLAPGGWLLLEHGFDQACAVAGLLEHAGFRHPLHRHDLAGHVRCTGAQVPH